MSKLDDIQTWGEHNEADLYLFTGHDSAIIGVAQQATKEPCVVYSLAGIIKNLMEDGMTSDEAFETFSYQIEGTWFGDNTPYIMQDLLA